MTEQPAPDTGGAVAAAVSVLRRGGLVAFPTETVYGLGVDAANPTAVARLYAVKGRPADHPVIVHLGDPADLDRYARGIPPAARTLAAACWPGPLTLVLRRRPDTIVDAVTGGLETVGLRVPAAPIALDLLRAFGSGIAAPSANRFGRVSPTSAADVRADLGSDVEVVLDGGACAVGIESTIVDCTTDTPALLRPGAVSLAALEELVGRLRRDSSTPAPGTLPAHYAPRARVQLLETDDSAPGALEAIRSRTPTARVVLIDRTDDVDAYARELYARLRAADSRHADVIVARLPSPEGVGLAVRDRLQRAAGAGAETR